MVGGHLVPRATRAFPTYYLNLNDAMLCITHVTINWEAQI